MDIKRNGTQPSARGPVEWFTGLGSNRFGVPAQFARPSRRREGGPIEEIRPGDVVWFEPNERHWHGASPTTAMTHIAIAEALDGAAVHWMDKVTDDEYGQ